MVDDAIAAPRGELNRRAKDAAVTEGVLDRDILKRHWEVYSHDIRQPRPTKPIPKGALWW